MLYKSRSSNEYRNVFNREAKIRYNNNILKEFGLIYEWKGFQGLYGQMCANTTAEMSILIHMDRFRAL